MKPSCRKRGAKSSGHAADLTKNPKYKDSHEVNAPSLITSAQLNLKNDEFWADAASRDTVDHHTTTEAIEWLPKNLKPQTIVKQYLARHEIPRRLKHLGITRTQLDGVFFRRNVGDEFSLWRIINTDARPGETGPDGKPVRVPGSLWPDHLLNDMRAWCTLRWLILDSPQESRDKRDAETYVALYLAEPIFTAQLMTQRVLAAGRKASNDASETKADDAQVKLFEDWERMAKRAWGDKHKRHWGEISSEELVRKYLLHFGLKSGSRQGRRLRRLISKGRISR